MAPSEEDSQSFSVNGANGEVYKLRGQDAKERQFWVSRLRREVDNCTNQTFREVGNRTRVGDSPNFISSHTSIATYLHVVHFLVLASIAWSPRFYSSIVCSGFSIPQCNLLMIFLLHSQWTMYLVTSIPPPHHATLLPEPLANACPPCLSTAPDRQVEPLAPPVSPAASRVAVEETSWLEWPLKMRPWSWEWTSSLVGMLCWRY